MKKSNRIDPSLYSFFWDCDPEHLDTIKHSDFIMYRIMERGTYDAMCWLKKTYTDHQRYLFLERKGYRVLPFRELNYWLLISGADTNRRKELIEKARIHNNVWQRFSH